MIRDGEKKFVSISLSGTLNILLNKLLAK